MILVDTSIWIDHLHHTDPRLSELLGGADVCVHPMIIGELALGSLRDTNSILDLLSALARTTVATHEEILSFVQLQTDLHRRRSVSSAASTLMHV